MTLVEKLVKRLSCGRLGIFPAGHWEQVEISYRRRVYEDSSFRRSIDDLQRLASERRLSGYLTVSEKRSTGGQGIIPVGKGHQNGLSTASFRRQLVCGRLHHFCLFYNVRRKRFYQLSTCREMSEADWFSSLGPSPLFALLVVSLPSLASQCTRGMRMILAGINVSSSQHTKDGAP